MSKVILVGASADPEKYANRAFHLLQENGHDVYPIHPKLETLDGVKVYSDVSQVPGAVDTITLYVSKEISTRIGPAILKKAPKRLIFNPGAENPELSDLAAKAGIKTMNACTLVLLTTHQFDR